MILWLLLIAHFLGDFTFQPSSWAEGKTRQFRYLAGHALVYALTAAVALFGCSAAGWKPFWVIALTHFAIDWLRVRADRTWKTPMAHFASFAVDQVLHVAVIAIVVWGFGLKELVRPWVLALPIPLDRVLRYGLLFLIIQDPAAVFVKKLSVYISGGNNETPQRKEEPVGRIIGKLERIIIAIFVLCDQIGGIGFVLTAKSLARYKQLNERDFAERYLVGTLSSTAVAVITALLLK